MMEEQHQDTADRATDYLLDDVYAQWPDSGAVRATIYRDIAAQLIEVAEDLERWID